MPDPEKTKAVDEWPQPQGSRSHSWAWSGIFVISYLTTH